ncbi:MAG TPA: hypothetical protein VES42_03010 [Pilimelia sp.]|nr:hypothetical protein [Pilimelia sp.]
MTEILKKAEPERNAAEPQRNSAEPQRDSVLATGLYGRPRRHIARLAAVAVAIVAVFAAAAVGYSSLQPRVYGAQADFLITPRSDLSDTAAERAMVTQVMIISSDPVLGPVAGRFKMSVSRLRDKVTAEMVGRSNLLRVTVADEDEVRALELVRLITAEYLTRSAPAPGALAGPGEEPPTRSAVLSPATLLEQPLQPQPIRALAAGVLLGLLAAAVAMVVLMRPRWLTRPITYWK